MIENEGVIEESPASMDEQMVSALEGVNEESPASEPSSTGDDGSDTEQEVEASDSVEKKDKQKDEPDELVPKKSFLRRINGLQASKRKAEESAATMEGKLVELQKLLEHKDELLTQANERFEEWDTRSEAEIELDGVKLKKRESEIRTEVERESRQRYDQAMFNQKVENEANTIIESAHKLAEEYPTVTAEELVIKLQTAKSGVTITDVAKDLHKKRLAYYKKTLAKQHGTKHAPTPMHSQGAAIPLEGSETVDMLKALEAYNPQE